MSLHLPKVLLCTLLLTAALPAHAAGTPDLSKCKALQDKEAYEDDYEDYSYLVEGKDGWLFRTEQDFRTEFKTSEEGIARFREFTNALKQKGTQLIVAFPPTRGIAASDKVPLNAPLAEGYDPAKARAAYASFIRTLNTESIPVVGTPNPRTGAGYFYKADQHWTNEGAQEMAQAIAASIKKYPAYAKLKKTEFVTTATKGEMLEGKFNEALKGLCKMKMPDQKANGTQTSPKGAKADAAALFGAQDFPEVVLVGTSNSKRDEFDMNFAGHLKQALSADVYNAAISGGGLDDSILAYLSSDHFEKSPPKFLIWEIPGYYNLLGEDARKTLRKATASLD